jgi:drug/metabolite transporter (DMT)-like permease
MGSDANAEINMQQGRIIRPSARANTILLGAQIAIGAAAIFARFALHGAGPVEVSALRLTIAALPLLVFSWKRSKKLSIPRRHEVLFACSGVALAIHFATWIASLQYTSVAVSTLLVCTAPVWTALYNWLILKQKMGKQFWFALLVAGCGVGLILSSSQPGSQANGLALVGDLLAVTGAIAFAAYLIAIRSVSSHYPTLVIVGRTYSWAALTLTIAALVLGQGPPGNDLLSWAGIIAMALISQILGHTGMNASLKWFSSSTVAFSTLLEPVFAALLAAMIFSERISALTLCGSVQVLISLAVILRFQPISSQEQIAVESNEL